MCNVLAKSWVVCVKTGIGVLLLQHSPQLVAWTVSILATELSPTVLGFAQEGGTPNSKSTGRLPTPYLVKYISKQEDKWCVKDGFKRLIHFRYMIFHQPWPVMTTFDLVSLHSIMIYFDLETKRTILKKIRHCLFELG